MKILLTGAEGQVGWELQRTLAPLGAMLAVTRHQMDLGRLDTLQNAVRDNGPDLIVNAAAYTAVDRAEEEEPLARRINGEAPGVLAEEARRLGALLIHYSTDYVFDGTGHRPYHEDDTPAPLNVYGATKLAGEQAIRDSGADHLILRTSWIYGARRNNFLLTMLRLARERDELRIVEDQVGSPTWCRLVAEATALMVASTMAAGRQGLAETLHLTAGGETSWYGFAREIFQQATELGLLDGDTRVLPIPSSAYPTPARRPSYSVLDNDRLQARFGLRLPDWRPSLRAVLEGLAGG